MRLGLGDGFAESGAESGERLVGQFGLLVVAVQEEEGAGVRIAAEQMLVVDDAVVHDELSHRGGGDA